MTFDARDQESNSHTSGSGDQNSPSPEHSASIHLHRNIMCGLQERLSRFERQVVSDHPKGILAVEKVLALLQGLDREPFPGFIDHMMAEFARIREELGALDPKQPSNVHQFVAIANRIEFLSRTFSFQIGCWAPKTDPGTSAANSNDRDTNH